MYKYKDGLLNTEIGTYLYRAPEMHRNDLYDGSAIDIFGIAIVLFIMRSGSVPFGSATSKDYFYRYIVDSRFDKFWKSH